MHGVRFSHRRIEKACPFIHVVRLNALFKAVSALLSGGKLTLTYLGRHLQSGAFCKHNIKCVDRLLGNPHLRRERFDLYRFIAHWLIGSTPRPLIVVDWSDCLPGHEYLMLKAALPVGGRALSVYEEVHPLRCYNRPKTHRAFLRHLKAVLPESCCPILVTDAGFRGPWFREVERLGWDWVGRVRNKIKYRLEGSTTWRYISSLYPQATARAKFIGQGWLSKKQPYLSQLYLMKKPKKDRVAYRSRRYRKMYKDPWLIGTSLPPRSRAARWVMKLYERRMQIEQTFRDIKNYRHGFGLNSARTSDPERLQILLLIATLAMIILWLMGLIAKAKAWGQHFQVNTPKKRAVLSIFFLGWQTLGKKRFPVTHIELVTAENSLPNIALKEIPIA